MRFYHASDHDIKWPCLREARRNCVDLQFLPALFANTTVLEDYGNNVYEFELEEDTHIFPMSSKMYIGMRFNAAYRAGMFDAVKRAGYDVLMRKQSEGDTTLVVLNFDKIKNWRLT